MPLLKNFNQICVLLTPRKIFNPYIPEMYSDSVKYLRWSFFKKLLTVDFGKSHNKKPVILSYKKFFLEK